MSMRHPKKLYLSRTDEERIAKTEERWQKIQKREAKKPPHKRLYRDVPDLSAEETHSKWKQIASNLRGRGVTLKFTPISPPLKATNPQEAKEAFVKYIEEKTKDQQEN